MRLPEILENWVVTLPPEVQTVVRRKPPTTCYRSIENGGHYWLKGITENNGTIAYTVMHGSDSFLPGFIVYHIDPDSLMACGCGQWSRPQEEQVKAAKAVSEAMLAVIRRHPDLSEA